MKSEIKTISDEKELENIFGLESDKNDKNEKKKGNIGTINRYDVRELMITGFMDMETWNKIKEFEKNNPDKIKKWKEEGEEKRDMSRLGRNDFIGNNGNDIKRENIRTLRTNKVEELINNCLILDPKNSFVLSVKQQFDSGRNISEKQISVLNRILSKARMFEDL